MSVIKINKLSLENFKCHNRLVLDAQGRNASIYGDNAAGKTSIYDALTWLLFGKDSKGNGEKNIDLKPLGPDGQVADHQAITAVEAELSVDGQTITLRRTLREIWSKKRGSGEETFDGNASEYFVDGVPQKKYGYDAKIREIVPEDIFRLLTSVTYFPRDLSWQTRRATLFDIVSPASDAEIMATDPKFAPLASAAGALSLDDFKRKLQADRKKISGAKTDAPARISELQNLADQYRAINRDDVQARLDSMTAKKSLLEADLANLQNGDLTQESAKLRAELAETKSELSALEMRNIAHKVKPGSSLQAGILQAREEAVRKELVEMHRTKQSLQQEIHNLLEDIDKCRSDWARWNDDVFSVGTCPTCGQVLPGVNLDAAKAKHQERVERGKKQAIEQSERLKARLSECEAQKGKILADIQSAEKRRSQILSEIKAIEAELASVTDLPEYAGKKEELNNKINAINYRMITLSANQERDTFQTRADIRACDDEIKSLNYQLSKTDMIADLEIRIADLRKQALDAAARLEDIDKYLWLIDEFTRYKAGFLEDSVNGLFRLARFRLFRRQANGGQEDRCDVTCGGVPYASINSGAQINVGIDIINVMSKHYGVSVPLFVDNAESVTKLENANTQLIKLIVSESDQELRCEYED